MRDFEIQQLMYNSVSRQMIVHQDDDDDSYHYHSKWKEAFLSQKLFTEM